MAYNLLITKGFEDDLASVLEYILKKLYNPVAAGHLLDKIETIIRIINDNPFIYLEYSDEEYESRKYRYAVILNYLIFYRIDENNDVIIVMRLLYGGQDISNILK